MVTWYFVGITSNSQILKCKFWELYLTKFTDILLFRCSEDVDQFNVQFTKDQRGPPKPFYLNYLVGNYAMQITASLWVIQALVYVFRIMCLADFSLYLTQIQLKSDPVSIILAG